MFWGTPLFALPSLRALTEEGHEIVGVVTQPDRRSGRGRKLTPSPVRQVAEEEGLPVLTPETPGGEDFLRQIRELKHQRDAALEAHDQEQLRRVRRHIHKLKRQIRRATV